MTGTNTGPFEAAGIPPTGRTVETQGIDTFRFRGGLISRYRTFVDVAGVMRQLGVAPEEQLRGESSLA